MVLSGYYQLPTKTLPYEGDVGSQTFFSSCSVRMATSGVALSLLCSTPCKDWARVQLPVKPPAGSSSGSEDGQPAIQGAVALLPPVPEGLQHRRSVLQRVQSLSRDLPFVAWLTGGVDESIQIVCAKVGPAHWCRTLGGDSSSLLHLWYSPLCAPAAGGGGAGLQADALAAGGGGRGG